MIYKCLICSKVYESKRASCYCSKECRRIVANEKSKLHKRVTRSLKPTVLNKYECFICKATIESKRKRKYCSKKCKDVVTKEYRLKYKKDKKEQIRKANSEYYKKNNNKH